MNRTINLVTGLICMIFCHFASATVISYDLLDLGNNRFECIYVVKNDDLRTPIKQFTLSFDEDYYGNIQVTSGAAISVNWDEIILLPTGLGVPFEYDALTLADGIGLGQSVGGFSVSYDWFGTGLPGKQPFEIINPSNSQPIYSGNTVPEATTIILFAFGGMMLRKKH